MIFSAPRSRAFTLIEVIVTLAVIGIALAVVGPALIMPRPERGIAEVLTASRRAALRRGESISLRIRENGDWQAVPARASTESLLSGSVPPLRSGSVEILISAVGVCTVQRGRLSADDAFNPLTCSVVNPDRPR
ncbi:MAG: type II secretion system protein [Gemmatimonadales bacterium]